MEQKKIYMAPMQGVTEAPFRNAFDKYFGGVDGYYTPFIRWEHQGVRRKDIRDIEPERNKVACLIPQLMAGSAEEAEQILPYILEAGYREVDLNMGCAYPVLTKKKKGCGILPYPDQVADLLQVVTRHPDVKFSVKIRLGLTDKEECLKLVSLFNSLPLERIVVHARTGVQQYDGACDADAFNRFAAACSHPVFYNGDVLAVDGLERWLSDSSPAAGVMVGRGLLDEPWKAAEFRSGHEWTSEEKLLALKNLHADVLDHYVQNMLGGEKQLLMKMKGIWEYLLVNGNKKARKKIKKAQKMSDYTEAVGVLIREASYNKE